MTFEELFVGGSHCHGVWDSQTGARTVKVAATPQDYADHLGGRLGLGLVPVRLDGTCRFGAIDIDVDTIDHLALWREVQKRRMPLHVCRSKSGGAHLYIFIREPGCSAVRLRSLLSRFATLLGHPRAEVFPKQDKVDDRNLGNWINLPYFDSDRGNRYNVIESGRVHLDSFIDTIDWYDEVRATKVDERPSNLSDYPPCLRRLLEEGKVPEGNRNNSLMNFGVFYRKSRPNDWQDALNHTNKELLNPPLDEKELEGVLNSLSRKSYQYLCKVEPFASRCDMPSCKKLRFGVANQEWDEDKSFTELKVSHLRKMLSDPPRYILNVNGTDLELSSEEFLSYARFENRVLEKLDLVLPERKKGSWKMTIQLLLTEKEDIEAPPEASLEGDLMEMLLQFCALRDRAKERDDILRGIPFEEGGKILFRSRDLRKYMSMNMKDVSVGKLYTSLRKVRCEHTVMRVRGGLINLWAIPVSEIIYREQKEDFDLPRAEGTEEEL